MRRRLAVPLVVGVTFASLFTGPVGEAAARKGTQARPSLASIVELAKRTVSRPTRHPAFGSPSDVQVSSVDLSAEGPGATPHGCCSMWQGFNITGTLVAPTTVGVPCVNCVAGAAANHVAVPFPMGPAFVGENWSTLVTFHSTIPGPCSAHFVWFSFPLNRVVAGNSVDIPDCGANTLWIVNFFNNAVPNVPGNAVAVGVVQASDGKEDTDFMQFVIQ